VECVTAHLIFIL